MAIRRLLLTTAPADLAALKQPAQPVRFPNPDLMTIVRDIIDTMQAGGGIGLAATMIGVPLRIAVVAIPARPADGAGRGEPLPAENHVLVNPHVLNQSAERELGPEGNLSMPGVRGDVPRPKRISVEYYDIAGKKHRMRAAEGLLARVILHELDMLDGIFFTERMPDLAKLIIPPAR